MKKNAWPWIGETSENMGARESRNLPITDSNSYDTLTPNKSIVPDEMDPVTNTSNGVIGGLEESRNFVQDKECTVLICKDNSIQCEFDCDVANTTQEKTAGLQVYSHLSENAGLFFPYKKARDVLYHMGTVSFPIDILFIGANGSIQKIAKNILPGTLGTFGCANTQYVLEIVGGLCDKLSIEIGNKIKVGKKKEKSLNKIAKENGVAKNIIFKYASTNKSGFENFCDYPIFTANDGFFEKTAERKVFSSMIDVFPPKEKQIVVVNFDRLIDVSPNITVYKRAAFSESNIFMDIDGDSVSVDNPKKVIFSKFSLAKDDVLLSGLKSFGDFIAPCTQSYEIFSKMASLKNQKSKDTLFICASKHKSLDKNLLNKKLKSFFGNDLIRFAEVFGISSDAKETVNEIHKKYSANVIYIADSAIEKRAGSVIPQEVITTAKKIVEMIDDLTPLVKEISDNFMKNSTEFETKQLSPEALKNVRGQFSQSSQKIAGKIKDYLRKIQGVLQKFDSIKDISESPKLIDAIIENTKAATILAQDIFDLQESLEKPDFVTILTDKSKAFEKSIEDLVSTFDNTKEYILDNILGTKMLSS